MLPTLLGAAVAMVGAAYFAYGRPRHFPVYVLAVGTLRFSIGRSAGDVALSAWWLLWLLLGSVVALVRLRQRPAGCSASELWHGVFLAWCLFEAWRASSLAFGIRMFLKLLYPLGVAVVARRAMLSRGEFRAALKWILGASFAASLLVGGFTQRCLPSLFRSAARVFWAAAPFADHASLMAVLAVVGWRVFKQRRYVALALWFGGSSVFVGIRTGIAASAIGLGVFAVLSFRRRVAVPALAGLYLATASSLFLLPHLRERTFYRPAAVDPWEAILRPDTLPTDDINVSGRHAMWQAVLERFFAPDPVLGSGLGATQAWFYSGGYAEARVEHSSYVRLLADTGVVGLVLFVAAVASCLWSAARIYRAAPRADAGLCALCVLCSFPALLFCMGFDNVLNYALPAGQYPFAFTGIMLGLWERRAIHERVREGPCAATVSVTIP